MSKSFPQVPKGERIVAATRRVGRAGAVASLAVLAACGPVKSSTQPTPPPESTVACGALAPPELLGASGVLDSNHALSVKNTGGNVCVYGDDGEIIGYLGHGAAIELECRSGDYVAVTAPSTGLTGAIQVTAAAEQEEGPHGPLHIIPTKCSAPSPPAVAAVAAQVYPVAPFGALAA